MVGSGEKVQEARICGGISVKVVAGVKKTGELEVFAAKEMVEATSNPDPTRRNS